MDKPCHYNNRIKLNYILYFIEKYFCLYPNAVMLAQGYNWSKWARLKSNTKISFVNGGNRILKCLDFWDKYTKWSTNIFKLVVVAFYDLFSYLHWMLNIPISIPLASKLYRHHNLPEIRFYNIKSPSLLVSVTQQQHE